MRGLGLGYMEPANRPNPSTSQGLTNPNLAFITWRTTWDLLEPTDGNIDFGYLDACVAASRAHNKPYSIQIVGGLRRPQWFINLISGTNELFNTADGNQIPVPWGAIFKMRWHDLIGAIASRYKADPLFIYFVMAAVGRLSESMFANTVADKATVDAMARAVYYADGPSAWLAGGQIDNDFNAEVFAPVPVVRVTGNPFLDQIGVDTLKKLVDCGQRTHRSQFGVRSDGLTDRAGGNTALVEQTAADCIASGYQSHNAMNDATRLNNQLQFGFDHGARFIEVWQSDCVNPAFQSILADWNSRIIAG